VSSERLAAYLDQRLGQVEPITVEPMQGGGSCEIFAVDRGDEHWVLRRAPRHFNVAGAHDVVREFRILDAIQDTAVPLARPVLACDDPDVFGAPFYVMERIDGRPVLASVPAAWSGRPETHGAALEQLVDALVAIHGVDWEACGLGDLAPRRDRYLAHQVERWLDKLASYGGRDVPAAHDVADWLAAHCPPQQPFALCHGDYKLDNVLFSPDTTPHLLAVVDWEMASVGDPLVDLAWALIFHPCEGTIPLGRSKEPTFSLEHVPGRAALVDRYADDSSRDVSGLGWYDVYARWKLAIALEGSYAKFVQGRSDKPIHEFFGTQVDLLLASAQELSS
jgi:aminoglycoside phosphotransferase (APT) family kinase protein